jgi:hypothetical protein
LCGGALAKSNAANTTEAPDGNNAIADRIALPPGLEFEKNKSAQTKRTSPMSTHHHLWAYGLALLNYLISGGQQRLGDGKAESLGGPEVDNKLERRRLNNRQVGRLCALEDPAGIDAHLMIGIRKPRAITHEAACDDLMAVRVSRRDCMPSRQHDELLGPKPDQRIVTYQERTGTSLDKGGKDRIEVAFAGRLNDLNMLS